MLVRRVSRYVRVEGSVGGVPEPEDQLHPVGPGRVEGGAGQLGGVSGHDGHHVNRIWGIIEIQLLSFPHKITLDLHNLQ